MAAHPRELAASDTRAAASRRRVCVLIPSHWSGKIGGAEMQARMLVERLASRPDVELHVVARNVDPEYRPHGYMLHRVPASRQVAGTFVLESRALLDVLRRVDADVVYQRVACTYTGVAAYYARTAGRRFVWHVSSDNDLAPRPRARTLKSLWQRPLQAVSDHAVRYGARHADVVVVQTREQAILLAERHHRTDARRVANFHPLPPGRPVKPEDRLTVCWLGNVKPLKQPELFLRLARDFASRSDVEFVLAGAVQMPPRAWAAAKSAAGELPALRELGAVSPDAANDLLARSHVLVNTSRWEGFPNTFIQAWLREVAVVSLTVNPDGVFDGDANGLCAHGDYGRMRAQLEALLSNAALRRALGARGAAYARAHHSAANVDRLVELLLE
jgi:glycosyltransferase involved in cell wall biosynthesis